jgi:hypothetical protein
MTMKHAVTDLITGKVTIEDIPPGVDPKEWMRQRMDDCPLCQEARARGEVPVFGDPEQLRNVMENVARRQRMAARRPRWRTLKRKVR